MIAPKLRELRKISEDPCVTILINTHRTFPENKQDSIALKNALTEAEKRLLEHYEKRAVINIIQKLHELVESVDHNFNLESLALFASPETAEMLRLPIRVEPRVHIGQNFALRDVIRAVNRSTEYYILTLSQQMARLMMAFNDSLEIEYREQHVFPIKNNTLYTTDKMAKSAGADDTLTTEFFNRVDKHLVEQYKQYPLPVIIATEERNQQQYMEVADRKDIIIGFIHRNRDEEKPHEIIRDAWPVVDAWLAQQRLQTLGQLEHAQSQQKALSDLNDIFHAANEGRAELLLVERDYIQPARIVDGNLVFADDPNEEGVYDDIVDEIVDKVIDMGGRVVYLPEGTLEQYQKCALIVRY